MKRAKSSNSAQTDAATHISFVHKEKAVKSTTQNKLYSILSGNAICIITSLRYEQKANKFDKFTYVNSFVSNWTRRSRISYFRTNCIRFVAQEK